MQLASAHRFFNFYNVYSNTLDHCLRWLLSHVQYGYSLEDSSPALRVLFCLRRFWRGFWGCRWIFLIVPTRSGSSFPSNIHGVSALVYRLSTVWLLIWRRLCGYCLHLISLWWQGLWSSWLGLICNAPGIYLPDLCFLVSWRTRFWWDAYLISDGIFEVVIFTSVMWVGENKIEVIE